MASETVPAATIAAESTAAEPVTVGQVIRHLRCADDREMAARARSSRPMADAASVRATPRLRLAATAIERKYSRYGWTLTGTREQLIAAGYCTAAHFPEGRKRKRYEFSGPGRDWQIEAVKGGSWRLRIDHLSDEVKEYDRTVVQEALDELPCSAEQVRQRLGVGLAGARGALLSSAELIRGGFRVSAGSMSVIEALFERLAMAFANASIEYDAVSDHAERSRLQRLLEGPPAPKLPPLVSVATAR